MDDGLFLEKIAEVFFYGDLSLMPLGQWSCGLISVQIFFDLFFTRPMVLRLKSQSYTFLNFIFGTAREN
jgi:hypothetical protein